MKFTNNAGTILRYAQYCGGVLHNTPVVYCTILWRCTAQYCGGVLHNTVVVYTAQYCGGVLHNTAVVHCTILWWCTAKYCGVVLHNTAWGGGGTAQYMMGRQPDQFAVGIAEQYKCSHLNLTAITGDKYTFNIFIMLSLYTNDKIILARRKYSTKFNVHSSCQ